MDEIRDLMTIPDGQIFGLCHYIITRLYLANLWEKPDRRVVMVNACVNAWNLSHKDKYESVTIAGIIDEMIQQDNKELTRMTQIPR